MAIVNFSYRAKFYQDTQPENKISTKISYEKLRLGNHTKEKQYKNFCIKSFNFTKMKLI